MCYESLSVGKQISEGGKRIFMLVTEEIRNELSPFGEQIEIDPHNRRIKVYQLKENEQLVAKADTLLDWAADHSCDKVIVYCKGKSDWLQEDERCEEEGKIDRFFRQEDAYIYSFFLSPDRQQRVDLEQENRVLHIVDQDDKEVKRAPLPDGYHLRKATKDDVGEMARLYDQVFDTYPVPMNDPTYIEQMMDDHVYFTVVEHDGELVSACSADVWPEYKSAEMTDCATLPEHRGKGLLSQQFIHLEQRMLEKGVTTFFSYSRAVSTGMNLINARLGYQFRGRMVQNSNIAGRFEDMNLWVKAASDTNLR